MKEKPIIFGDEMVRAILAGRKTVTRRVCKPELQERLSRLGYEERELARELCPYGAPGDRLWVREAWCLLRPNGWWATNEPKDMIYNAGKWPRRNACAYRCETGPESDEIRRELGYKWTPSIHMPRWASRITLKIVSVRVERLQDISEEDALKEGCEANEQLEVTARQDFADLWDRLNAKRGYGWEVNPWVWRIEFRRAACR